jgi:hypothetical protein
LPDSVATPTAQRDFDDAIERERSAGRLWRIRDLMRSRVGQSDYDRELFRLYADALANMKDDDEAGRYYFLSGARDGRAGELCMAFLNCRNRRKLHLFWSDMPKAASRVTATSIPDICRLELEANGHTPLEVSDFLNGLVTAEITRQENRVARNGQHAMNSSYWRGSFVIVMIMGLLGLIVALGSYEAFLWCKLIFRWSANYLSR